ncbi:phospholipase D-like domain-containing protein [Kitasatospora sp. NPDC088391]|uniref:phospholipase D-like domain-containing protein n=1 Tax=Kitasatospora sp. NPDC088391 TaxID=3364074 RepID=UPI00382CC0D4
MTTIKALAAPALAVVLAVTAAPGGAVAAAAPAPLVTTGPVFNDPTDPAKQDAIFGQLSRLIDGAVPGSTVMTSQWAMNSDWLAGRLSAAHLRGVNVQVLLDHTSVDTAAGAQSYGKLAAGLAQPSTATSWVRVCPLHEACLAKDPNPADAYYSNNHNKFWLFSSTTGSSTGTVPVDDVVVQTSANQTLWDRQSAWNDAMTVAGNAELFNDYAGYFAALSAAQRDRGLQVADYPVAYQAGPAQVSFFPRAATDPVIDVLNAVAAPVNGRPACFGNSPGYGTTDGRTVVRVAMHQISRVEVAEKLWELDDAGCYVDVVYRTLDTNGSDVLKQLTRPTRYGGITLHKLDDDAAGRTATHSKYLLVEGGYQGLPNRKIVWTGSHTYTYMALSANDEALLKYDDPAVHDAYRSNFWAQRAAADAQNAPAPTTP